MKKTTILIFLLIISIFSLSADRLVIPLFEEIFLNLDGELFLMNGEALSAEVPILKNMNSGRMTTVTDWQQVGTITYHYDVEYNLSIIEYDKEDEFRKYEFNYDDEGWLIEILDGETREVIVTYERNDWGLLIYKSVKGSTIFSYFDYEMRYSYDKEDRVVEMIHSREGESPDIYNYIYDEDAYMPSMRVKFNEEGSSNNMLANYKPENEYEEDPKWLETVYYYYGDYDNPVRIVTKNTYQKTEITYSYDTEMKPVEKTFEYLYSMSSVPMGVDVMTFEYDEWGNPVRYDEHTASWSY